jgi:hypothetical protein
MCGWFLMPSGQFMIVCEIEAVYYPIWLSRNHDPRSKWSDMSTSGMFFFQRARNSAKRVGQIQSEDIHLTTCSCLTIVKQQSLTMKSDT